MNRNGTSHNPEDQNDTLLFLNYTHHLSEHFSPREAFIIACYGLIVLISAFGNVLVCHVVSRNPCMRGPTYVFIANLALSDLMMTLLNIPFNVARILMNNWPFGSFMCSLVPVVQVSSVYVSTFTMTCIALDRYRVVTKPMKPRLGYFQALTVVALVWVVSFALSLPHGLFNRLVEMFTYRSLIRCRAVYPEELRRWITLITVVTQYVLPVSVTGIVYGLIMAHLCSRHVLGVVTEAQVLMQARAKRKTIKMLVLVVILFALCWFPLNLYHIIHEFVDTSSSGPHRSTIFFVCHWLAMSSVCYNPFIYCWLNEQFRTAAHACFHCIQEIGHNHESSIVRSTQSKSQLSDNSTRRKWELEQKNSLCAANGKCPGTKTVFLFDRGRCLLALNETEERLSCGKNISTSTSTPDLNEICDGRDFEMKRCKSLVMSAVAKSSEVRIRCPKT